jgi:HK97 family phage portal protein
MSIFDKFAPQTAGEKALLGGSSGTDIVQLGSAPSTYTAGRTERIADVVGDVSFVYEVQHGVLSYAAPVPIKVFALEASGERYEDFNDGAYQLLRNPNPRHDAYQFREYLLASRLNFGEHFAVKVRDQGGTVRELWPVRPDRMKEVPDPDTGQLLGFILNPDSPRSVGIPIEDLIWGTSWNPTNDYRGLSPVGALRWQVELGRDAEQVGVDLLANGAFLRGALKVQKKAGVESLRRLAKQFRDMMIGSGNRYRIPVLEDGVEFVPLQLNPVDSEFINTMGLTRARIAGAYGWALPEEFTSTQAPDLRRLRFQDAVVPLTSAIQSSLEARLMPEFNARAFPEFQLAHILEADFPQLVSALKEAVYSAQMTPNDARRKLNLPALAGGDDLFVPLNLSPVGEISENPRASDSGGGFGGTEGRTESTASALPGEPKALPSTKDATDNYRASRDRRLAGLSKALDNRIRGILKRELAEIRDATEPKAATLPLASDLERIVRKHDPELGKLIGQYLTQSAIAGATDAGMLTGLDPLDVARMAQTFSSRADAVAAAFGTDRGSWLIDLLSSAQAGDLDQRAFMNAVADGYGAKFSHYGERIARTEVAYAHEAAARLMWLDSGATGIVWNFGGGPCTTDVCPTLDGTTVPAGAMFAGIDGDVDGPPVHNYCTCFTTPSFDSLTPTGG